MVGTNGTASETHCLMPLHRLHVNRKVEAAIDAPSSDAGASPAAAQRALLSSSRLRKGCHCHKVQTILYINHEQTGDQMGGLGQVSIAALLRVQLGRAVTHTQARCLLPSFMTFPECSGCRKAPFHLWKTLQAAGHALMVCAWWLVLPVAMCR